jgi:hypothetical protein
MDESRGGSRIVYPKLFATLTEADLASQFRLASEERAWAGTAARRGPSMVILLTQLKVFQSIGHFLPLAQIPATALSYIIKGEVRAGTSLRAPYRPSRDESPLAFNFFLLVYFCGGLALCVWGLLAMLGMAPMPRWR